MRWFSLSSFLLFLLIGVISFYFIRNYLAPSFLEKKTGLRLSSFSGIRARGVEWRKPKSKGSIIPTLRVEKAGLSFGTWKSEEDGLIVLKVEGISYRIGGGGDEDIDEDGNGPSKPKKSQGRWTRWFRKAATLVLYVGIHNIPSLARVFSIHLSDIRIIFDDLGGMEKTIAHLRLGARINFKGSAPTDEDLPMSPISVLSELNTVSPPGSPLSGASSRAHPLASPLSPFTPPGSPANYFQNFHLPDTSFNDTPLSPPPSGTPFPPVIENVERPSSPARVKKTASSYSWVYNMWTRATIRATGHIVFQASIVDTALILPHQYISPTSLTAKSSITDLKSACALSNRPSTKSFQADNHVHAQSFASVGSIQSFLRPKPPRYALPACGGGFDRLLSIEGESKVTLGLGFAPKKGLLGEDTLISDVALGKVQTSLGGVDRVLELIKEKKGRKSPREEAKKQDADWTPRSMRRIILRAFESATLSFAQISVNHYLPASTSQPVSASSSTSDMSALPQKQEDYFTISLDITNLFAGLTAADSTNNERARNAFGTNPAPGSKVRGVAFNLRWVNIAVQCIAPGEAAADRHQLFAVREAEFDGLSTWRPSGWSREELLFANDPNLALVVGRGSVTSVDMAGDVQLLEELNQAWDSSRPVAKEEDQASIDARKTSVARGDSKGLLPRVRMVLDVGHVMVLLADRVSEHKTTLTIASEGLHLGCFTTYSDIIARRRDKQTMRSTLREEEQLYVRRQSAGDVNYALPPIMLKPELRRQYTVKPAELTDFLSISMQAEATMALEPISIHLTLTGENEMDQNSYEVMEIGKVFGTVVGEVCGREETVEGVGEVATLDYSTLSCAVDLGIDQGVKVNIWEKSVVKALSTMVEAHRPSSETPKHSNNDRSILDRLPSGISFRASLGCISVFVGCEDPNPNCDLQLVRGLWFQAKVTLEYAYYVNKAQTMRVRSTSAAPNRARLKLPEDITTQALAFHTSLSPAGGKAALIMITINDTFVKPIFNGDKFVKSGGTSLSHQPPPKIEEKEGDGFVGWDFRRPKEKVNLKSGVFSNNVPPLEIDDTEQAQRPLVRMPVATLRWLIQRDGPRGHSDVHHEITAKIPETLVVAGMSHVYCTLLALKTIQQINKPLARTKSTRTKKAINTKVSVSLPVINVHIALPLQEHLFITVRNMGVFKASDTGVGIEAEQLLLYVPSARVVGSWEELLRLKSMVFSTARPGAEKAFGVAAEALRIRIPHGYQLSKLVLNINAAVKATKLLVSDLSNLGFVTVKKPDAEDPKCIPPVRIGVKYVSLEAKDDPLETNLNLIFRTGLAEQDHRNKLEDSYEKKVLKLQALAMGEDAVDEIGDSKLTTKSTISLETARYKLDQYISQVWISRIRNAKEEQYRREKHALGPTEGTAVRGHLPITIVQTSYTAPLFRATMKGFEMNLRDLGKSREEVLQYMSDLNGPFAEDAQFSLMVPLHLEWKMDEMVLRLRDYPLPLVRLQPVKPGETLPAWHVSTPFIIAEELHPSNIDETIVLIPTEIVPANLGLKGAKPFNVEIAKTIMPVKTYARPVINIASEKTTEFAWGNSYQPGIQDFMKVIETLSHPPRDPSPRVGFWDKFRLILHWRVTMEFAGPVHLHLKGTNDPYAVSGHGAGFALAWRHNTKVFIAQPNPQYETVQIQADELLIVIPDLTALSDEAAIGIRAATEDTDAHREQDLIARRCTKPCARFLNGVRVGFGFVFERTCRPWNCQAGCGSTMNLMHRQCRNFEFRNHQSVILRSADAMKEEEKRVGHAVDSYEGFRSDYVHFSVSVVSPIREIPKHAEDDADQNNSLHFSPKAFAHFFVWWKLFDHTMSLPIRQGKLFPNSPPPSKKFGRSLGTIKYRFDLAPVYVSHMYQQVSESLWGAGKSQSLGVKARFGRFQADAHQRAQEKTVKHPVLDRTTVVVHKPFYAADLILDDMKVVGIRADFVETHPNASPTTPMPGSGIHAGSSVTELPHASALPRDRKAWFNYFDYIDADRRPLDRDPVVEIVDIGDCPLMFFSKRNKARQVSTRDGEDSTLNGDDKSEDSRFDIETSKFGHEKSHICYLGACAGVGPTQARITRDRIAELEARLEELTNPLSRDQEVLRNILGRRIQSLRQHAEDLSSKETRHIDDDTFQTSTEQHGRADQSHQIEEPTFENTFHVHCPKVFYNNASRNICFKYWFSSRDRKKHEYTTSHASLRGLKKGIDRRFKRARTGYNQDDLPEDAFPLRDDLAQTMLDALEKSLQSTNSPSRFSLPVEHTVDHEDLRQPSLGLPSDCIVKPKHRFLLLKPQIALRSEADENSIVLLAVEEISFKSFAVVDEIAQDAVTADVLVRNYVSMKGLQVFYPNEHTINRKPKALGIPRSLDFLPLEIFLDVKSEATDYERIVLKTDAALSFDKFNHLRMPRGLEWPDTLDEIGEPIEHLRLHQDLTTIIVPRLTLSATSKHYAALYNVITDLLLYKDPEHRKRSERIDSFTYSLDRRDANPRQFFTDLMGLQATVRELSSLQVGYERYIDRIDDQGREELFKIRTHLLDATEQLFTVFEAVAVNQARDDARAALKSANKLDLRIGNIAWHLLKDNLTLLLKLDLTQTLASILSNKDGSLDYALVLGKVLGLNPNADTDFSEVLSKHDPPHRKYKARNSFASACASTRPPVGGITIVHHVAMQLAAVKFRIEEKVGREVVDYLFSRQRGEKEKKAKTDDATKRTIHGDLVNESDPRIGIRRSNTGLATPALSRTNSSLSIINASQSTLDGEGESGRRPEAKFSIVPTKDVQEMKRRAAANLSFGTISLKSTLLILSYASDPNKKRKVVHIPDCTDFEIKTPDMQYEGKTWAWEDVFNAMKRDVLASAWQQRGHLVKQLFTNSSIFKNKNRLKSRRETNHESAFPHPVTSPSRLRYTVDPPPLTADISPVPSPVYRGDTASTSSLSRIKSNLSRNEGVSTPPNLHRIKTGEATSPVVYGSPASDRSRFVEADNVEADGEETLHEESLDPEGHGARVKDAMKGFLGKLRPKHHHSSRFENGSTEEISSSSSSERNKRSLNSSTSTNSSG